MEVAIVRFRRGPSALAWGVGILLSLFVLIQVVVGVYLLDRGHRFEAALLLTLGPLVSVLAGDALSLYMRVVRSLSELREAIVDGLS